MIPAENGRWTLWVAQGFGTGRLPYAPGTVGSAAGLIWFGLLVASGSLWIYLAGIGLGFLGSVWASQRAEQILQMRDPSSVVLDEIAAIPLCFLAWIGCRLWNGDGFPPPLHFVQANTWWVTLLIWFLFRLFDVLKPWPVNWSQALPGGWGVTVDDFLAALYVNLVLLLINAVWPLLR